MGDESSLKDLQAAVAALSVSCRPMRNPLALALLLGVACNTVAPPPPPQPVVATLATPAADHGLTVEEEARILALEDRREYDSAIVNDWVRHPNALHRIRIALALGRIGPHAFIDSNGDGVFTPATETRAGVSELAMLAKDPDRRVREMAAFALGEIGDLAGARTLFELASDPDGAVAAEAVEGMSKFGGDKAFVDEHLARYLWMADESWPEGVRARAIRYLFRFDDDRASAVALRALESPSSAIRQEAAYSLFRRPYAPARDQLALLMSDPNVLTRAYATTALGRIGDVASRSKLIAALVDPHPWVRTNAAIAIGRVIDKNRDAISAEHIPAILAAMQDPDSGARAAMIDTLGYYAAANETARARLLTLLRNGSEWERELAAGAIAKHFAPESETFAQLTDLTPWQIVRVLEAVENAPHGAAIRARYAASPDALVRATALRTIPDAAVNAERDLILARLDDPDVIVRAYAHDRFGHLPPDTTERWLETLKEAEVRERTATLNDARLAAIDAVARLEHPQRREWLASFLNDSDPVVRRVVAGLIAEKFNQGMPRYTPLPSRLTPEQYVEIVRWSREPHTATIHMTRGSIQLALLAHDAPMTAWNFAQLARSGYFNDSSFMRVVPNFVIQGGDPRNDMNGGPGYAIRDEINLQKYTRGAVGMALSGPDTGGSQFFITHSPQPHLDGGYTIFGRVYDGMSGVVDQTERGDRVNTITIDERPPATAEQINSVPNVSLPL